jgi:UDP-N-acetylmuramoylalanine--D-glutamate ligase
MSGMSREIDLDGRKVLVVGLARTGVATARFLNAKGAEVSTTEVRSESEMRTVIEELGRLAVSMEWGGHRLETFLKADLIVVSPGVDLNLPPFQDAIKKGVQVISEIELACRFLRVPMIAVTGTNGKTTTTLLIGDMLKKDGRKVGVGGNVGEPLILFADGREVWDVLVVEVSSFQLEAIEHFRPVIAVLLNVTEDHLDRYAGFDDYIRAKARIFLNQEREDTAILNRDDPVVMRCAEDLRAKKILFSLRKRTEEGAYSDGRTIFFRRGGKEEEYSLADARLKGVHNVENMTAAVAASRLFGCSREAVEAPLRTFEGLEHRLEFVREVEGVRFFNDSKGTNVGSVVKSLKSFSVPVILIAGGKDKNGDLGPLKGLMRQRVKHLILIGEAKARMKRDLGGITETTEAETLEEAVRLGYGAAKPGDVVLLSPACSSFDMFRDYKERGRVFKETVRKL